MGTSDKAKEEPVAGFPKFLMKVGGKQQFMTMDDAKKYYDSGYSQIVIAGSVLEADFFVREITSQERMRIIDGRAGK